MKLAIIILAHKTPELVGEIVKKLNHPKIDFFLHIDKRSNLDDFKRELCNIRNEGIYFSKREKSGWGGLGIVLGTINCLKLAIETDEYSHFILLSGQDYPVKTADELIDFCLSHPDSCFIEHRKYPWPNLNYNGYDRTNCYSFHFAKKRVTAIPCRLKPQFNFKGHILNLCLLVYAFFLPERKLPNGFTSYYGSQWWCLNKSTVLFILETLKNRPDFIEYHKYSLLPDEMFFQTIIFSHKGENWSRNVKFESRNLHFMIWESGQNHPKVLTQQDFIEIVGSGAFFCRKVDLMQSNELLNMLSKNC